MTADLVTLAIALAAALAATLIANRWRYHDGYRAGYSAGAQVANRELDDLLERLGIPSNETSVDSLATIEARLDDMLAQVDTRHLNSVKAA